MFRRNFAQTNPWNIIMSDEKFPPTDLAGDAMLVPNFAATSVSEPEGNSRATRTVSVHVASDNPRHTQAAISMNISVCTNAAWNILRFCFTRADIAFFRIANVLPVIATREEADELRRLVDGIFETNERQLEDAIGRIQTLLRNNGVPENFRPKFNAVHRATVDIRHHDSLRYLKLIRRLDDLCQLFEAAALLGIIADSERRKLITSWEDRLRSVSNTVFQRQRKTGDDANERRAARRVQEEAQNADGGTSPVTDEKTAETDAKDLAQDSADTESIQAEPPSSDPDPVKTEQSAEEPAK